MASIGSSWLRTKIEEATIIVIDETGLAQMLAGKRWFARRDRTIEHVHIVDHAVVEDGPPALVTALAEVAFGDGSSALYHLPLFVYGEEPARDAVEEPDRLRVLGDLMAHGTSLKGDKGTFHYGGPGLDPLSPPGNLSIRIVGAEQTNTSLVLDDAVIVKLFRRVEPGPNPDLEINRMLTTEGFPHVPAQVGEISYEGEMYAETLDLGIAQRFVHDAEEGWTHMLGHVRALYDQVHEQDAAEDLEALTGERAARSLQLIEDLGNMTASMHVALAREETEPDFAPEPISGSDVTEWTNRLSSALREGVRAADYGVGRFEDEILERVSGLHNLVPDLLGSKIRIHGDYHLGQVLRAPREWLVIDFEGEPLRPLVERREKESPLRDVAGMLRSLSYVATSVLFERAQPEDPEWARLSPWADQWEALARDSFLHAYLATSHEGRFLPTDRDVLTSLVDLFEIDKALYELRYERAHRPEWVRIPHRGIEKVLERGDAR
jgi:trehalose synthase-fused probable maltokinase